MCHIIFKRSPKKVSNPDILHVIVFSNANFVGERILEGKLLMLHNVLEQVNSIAICMFFLSRKNNPDDQVSVANGRTSFKTTQFPYFLLLPNPSRLSA
jgi:hypothetical protein